MLVFKTLFNLHKKTQWHSLTREEQAKYYEKARAERQKHMQMYPHWNARDNYRFGLKKKKRKRDKTDEPGTNGDPFLVLFQWHNLSRDQQAKYYEMAKRERQRHRAMYPGWTARDNYAKQKRKRSNRGTNPGGAAVMGNAAGNATRRDQQQQAGGGGGRDANSGGRERRLCVWCLCNVRPEAFVQSVFFCSKRKKAREIPNADTCYTLPPFRCVCAPLCVYTLYIIKRGLCWGLLCIPITHTRALFVCLLPHPPSLTASCRVPSPRPFKLSHTHPPPGLSGFPPGSETSFAWKIVASTTCTDLPSALSPSHTRFTSLHVLLSRLLLVVLKINRGCAPPQTNSSRDLSV